MRAVSEECGLQPVTIAMAFVYFEKLVLQGRLNKQNRKLVAAACVLLAAKISSDLRKPDVKQLIDVSNVSTHKHTQSIKENRNKNRFICYLLMLKREWLSGQTCSTCNTSSVLFILSTAHVLSDWKHVHHNDI